MPVKVSKKQKKKKTNIIQTVIVNVGGRGRGRSKPSSPPPIMLPPISSSIVRPQPSFDFASLFQKAISSFTEPTGGIKGESLLEQVQRPIKIDEGKQEAKIKLEQGFVPIASEASSSSISQPGSRKKQIILGDPLGVNVGIFKPGMSAIDAYNEMQRQETGSSSSSSSSSGRPAIIKAKDVEPFNMREIIDSFKKPKSTPL